MNQTAKEVSHSRIPELDGLRGIAVLMVVVYHAFAYSLQTASGLPAWLRPLYHLTNTGWLGVDLFFILSGFLITDILLKSRRRPGYFRNFYARRVLRIFPPYFAALAVIGAFYAGSGGFVFLSALFLSNVTPLFDVPMTYGPLWSLAVEEHFYFIWPLIVFLLPGPKVAWVAWLIVLAEPVLRAIGHQFESNTYMYSWFRFDGLAWGALLATWMQAPEVKSAIGGRAKIAFFTGVLLLAGGAPFGIFSRKTVLGASLLYTGWQLVFFAAIASAVVARPNLLKRVYGLSWLRWFGNRSYFLYLVHLMLFHLWDWLATKSIVPAWNDGGVVSPGPFLLRTVIVVGVSCGLAELSYRYYESPILALKKRFE